MAQEMVITPRTMSCINKQELELTGFKRQIGQRLTLALKESRGKNQDTCCHRTVQKILFTDEKNVTVEETFNKQNNRVYAQSSKEACKFMP